jgi:hypothetical protein
VPSPIIWGKDVVEGVEKDCAPLCAAVAAPPRLGLESRQVVQERWVSLSWALAVRPTHAFLVYFILGNSVKVLAIFELKQDVQRSRNLYKKKLKYQIF